MTKLNLVREPLEIMDCQVERLKQSRIAIMKVGWNSQFLSSFHQYHSRDQHKLNFGTKFLLEGKTVTTRNFRSFSKPRQFTIHKLLFIIYYSSITIHRFLGQFDISRSIQKFYYSHDTIHFREKTTIHVHYSFHRKLSLRVFKIRVTVLVQERIHALSFGTSHTDQKQSAYHHYGTCILFHSQDN